MGLADAPLLASAVGSTMFVVGSGQVSKKLVRAAVKRLQFSRASLIGTVLTKFDAVAHTVMATAMAMVSAMDTALMRIRWSQTLKRPCGQSNKCASGGVMSERMALKVAIDLMHVPSQVRLLRSEPLPEGVLMLLRIAAGDEETEQAAIALTGRSLENIRRAAMFFIEQILFAPNADSYRVLGTAPGASASDLRRNVALLFGGYIPISIFKASGQSSLAG